MAKYIIRKADQNDIAGIIKLRRTIKEFRPIEADEYRSFWNSQIIGNPYSIRYAFVGVNENSEIVAHLAMVPFRFLMDGEPRYGGSLCQLMVHEDFRQELLFPRLETMVLNGYQKLGIDFSFGLANRGEVKKAHLSFGFREIGDLAVYVAPYKLPAIARSLLKNKLLNAAATPGLYIAEKLLRLKRALNRPGPEITEISAFDPNIDAFLSEVQRDFPYSAVRSSAILNWRFNNSSEAKYHILITRKQGQIAGYAVLRRSILKGLDVLAVVDILFRPDQLDAGKSLLNAVDSKAMELGADISACLLNPHDPICKIIKKCGYFRTPERFSLIVHEPKGRTPHYSKNSFAKWHLTWFDHDAL